MACTLSNLSLDATLTTILADYDCTLTTLSGKQRCNPPTMYAQRGNTLILLGSRAKVRKASEQGQLRELVAEKLASAEGRAA